MRPNTSYPETITHIRDSLSAICWCLVQKRFCGLLASSVCSEHLESGTECVAQ